jgi:hypothetical protein
MFSTAIGRFPGLRNGYRFNIGDLFKQPVIEVIVEHICEKKEAYNYIKSSYYFSAAI